MSKVKIKITTKAMKALLKTAEIDAQRRKMLTLMIGKSNNEIAAEMPRKKATFHASVEWKALRKKAIATYGAKCMKCGYAPKDLRRINIDHIKPRKYYPHLALEFDNLQVLCGSCNKLKGNWDQTDWRAPAKQ